MMDRMNNVMSREQALNQLRESLVNLKTLRAEYEQRIIYLEQLYHETMLIRNVVKARHGTEIAYSAEIQSVPDKTDVTLLQAKDALAETQEYIDMIDVTCAEVERKLACYQ